LYNVPPCTPHSIPTRRSSDLLVRQQRRLLRLGEKRSTQQQGPHDKVRSVHGRSFAPALYSRFAGFWLLPFNSLVTLVLHPASKLDRKSTRLNSSHRTTSYAVF